VSKGDLLTYKLKHQLLYAKEKNLRLLSEWGRKLVERGWLSDAIDFFAAAKDVEGQAAVRRLAVEQGDVFLLRRCLTEFNAAATEQDWQFLGEHALALGKLHYAREAFRLSGDRKSMDKVDARINPPPAPETPGKEGEGPATEAGPKD
jgi:hypothetical protein